MNNTEIIHTELVDLGSHIARIKITGMQNRKFFYLQIFQESSEDGIVPVTEVFISGRIELLKLNKALEEMLKVE